MRFPRGLVVVVAAALAAVMAAVAGAVDPRGRRMVAASGLGKHSVEHWGQVALLAKGVGGSCDGLAHDACMGAGDCAWCDSMAVPGGCYPAASAKKLPASVFHCEFPGAAARGT